MPAATTTSANATISAVPGQGTQPATPHQNAVVAIDNHPEHETRSRPPDVARAGHVERRADATRHAYDDQRRGDRIVGAEPERVMQHGHGDEIEPPPPSNPESTGRSTCEWRTRPKCDDHTIGDSKRWAAGTRAADPARLREVQKRRETSSSRAKHRRAQA